MSRRSPSARWRSEHGDKVYHKTRLSAWLHLFALRRKPGHETTHMYPCQWGQWYRDGETADLHWHVGRLPRQGSLDGYEGKWTGHKEA